MEKMGLGKMSKMGKMGKMGETEKMATKDVLAYIGSKLIYLPASYRLAG